MRTLLAHGHIFKNAGSTLDWSLREQFGQRFCDHRDDKPMRQQGIPYLEQFLNDHEKIQAISSHHLCDPRTIANINIIPINLLRHPIERVRSVYDFERIQNADTPGAKAAKQYNFKDYVAWRMEPNVNRTIKDYQTFYLADKHTAAPDIEAGKDILSQALNYLSDVFCVGVVDRYNDSMVVFEDYIKKHIPTIDLSYIRQNTSDHKNQNIENKIQQVFDELGNIGDLLLTNNASDLALYEAANHSLDEKINALPNFEEKRLRFKQRCSNHT